MKFVGKNPLEEPRVDSTGRTLIEASLLRRLWRGRGWQWSALRVAILLLFLVITPVVLGVTWMTRMPGKDHAGALPPLSDSEKRFPAALERHVRTLAEDIGVRNVAVSGSLERSVAWLESELRAMGYEPCREEYEAKGEVVSNLIVEIPGDGGNEGIILIGAHYDSVIGSPGADDNVSGCAALLELARVFSPGTQGAAAGALGRTLRFVFFVNEEKPFAMTPEMGSFVHARGCRQRGERIDAMFSLESLGYFSDEPDSQQYPSPAFGVVYPTTGNFIAFVGDTGSRPLVQRSVALFREVATLPSEGAALPRKVAGVGWSDHWSFWMQGYQALMVTGTAPFRNPWYHTSGDTPDTLDYERMARVVNGLEHTIRRLAEGE